MTKKLSLAERIARWFGKPEEKPEDPLEKLTPRELLEVLRNNPHDIIKIVTAGNCWMVATKINQYANYYGEWYFVSTSSEVSVFDADRRSYVKDHCLFTSYEAAEAKHKVFLAHVISYLKKRVTHIEQSEAIARAIVDLDK